MAPAWDSAYFPPLDQCLDGGFQLMSWHSTFAGLSELSCKSRQERLRRYLTDDDTLRILIQCFAPFPSATSQSKAAFESRTSAINVAPTARGRYNIQQLKDDALWLSKAAGIDELSSIRLAILEWQARPAVQILQAPFEQDSDLFFPDGKFKNSTLGSKLVGTAEFKLSQRDIMESFESTRERHLRLLGIYLSERKYLLKTVESIILQASYRSTSRGDTDHSRLDEPQKTRHWIDNLAISILKAWNLQGVMSKSGKNWFVDVVLSMRSRMEGLEKGSGLLKNEEGLDEFEIAWRGNQVLESIHIMQITFTLIQIYPGLTRTDALVDWFRFMSSYRFFEQVETLFQDVHSAYISPFQANIALVSLAMLKMPTALETLQDISLLLTSAANSADSSPYLLSSNIVNEITEILTLAAAEGYCNASLAVFAWGIILQTLREYANATKSTKELRQSQRIGETYGNASPSEVDGGELPFGVRRPSPQRRMSTGSDTSQQATYLEDVLEKLNHNTPNEDSIQALVKSAVHQTHVFDIIANLATEFCLQFGSEHEGEVGLKIRLVLLELIRAAAEYVVYEADLVSATLAVLTGSERYWDVLERPAKYSDREPANVFFNDAFLMEKIFDVALSRFPYETLPFLKLCHTFATYKSTSNDDNLTLKSILDNMTSFTCAVPAGVAHQEKWVAGDVPYRELISDLEIFPDHVMHNSSFTKISGSRDMFSSDIAEITDTFRIPAQTPGIVLLNDKAYVVMWHYQYSSLNYLGLYLRQVLINKDLHHVQIEVDTSQIVSEIIGLITALLVLPNYKEIDDLSIPRDVSAAQAVLEEASDGLDRNQDVISVIFHVFEDELYKQQTAAEEGFSIELLIQCIEFMHALLAVLPSRVWSFLGRSGLIGIDGKESRISTIITSYEITSGRYGFLLGCTRLFDALIDDALTHSISRKARSKALTRFGDQQLAGNGVSDTVMKKILLNLERVMVDVLETSYNWRFVSQEQNLEINTSICLSLSNVLNYCFEVDDNPDVTAKLTGLLAPAADYLLEVFLSRSTNDLPTQPLLNIILEGINLPENTLSIRLAQRRTLQTITALKLSNTLVRVNRLLKYPPSHLEEYLFKSASVLIKLYAAHERYRVPSIELFESLVRGIGSQEQQPQSLLGYLGPNTAKHLLELLSVLDGPFNDEHLPISIWRFLSTVISHRQQWFALYLLTGTTPREALRDKCQPYYSSTQHIRPMLRVAIDRLSRLEKIHPEEAAAILEFITTASDFWPWVLTELQKEHTLLATLSNFLARLGTSAANASTQAELPDPYQIQVASLITTLFAMYIHVCNERAEFTFAKKLQPNLKYLIRHAVATPNYNASLHGNLQRNFEKKFSGCKLSHFKRTSLSQTSLGTDFYYSVERAGKMLSYDPMWAGKGKQSFVEEVSRANVNMSLVEAQINLLHSWKSLVIEMIVPMGMDENFLQSLALVIRSCLVANSESRLSEAIFTKIEKSRADLAFALIQRIFEAIPSSVEARSILKPAWNTLRSHAPNIGTALTSSGAEYDRTLLKILYIALQAHAPNVPELKNQSDDKVLGSKTSESTQIALEIIGMVVAQGFRSLTTALHENESLAVPMDFALVIAILRAALHVPGVDRHIDQLVCQFADDHTVRYATTLLSWSDQITVDHDPVYGELSITFLLELSTISALAESLAVEGVLTQISSAKLMGYFRRPDAIGPLDESMRMHSIWSRGVLPLVLNLLRAVGAPIAGEVAAFMNSFQNQMARAAKNLEVKSKTTYITLNLASEAQSLALITTILETYREAGASAGIISLDITPLKWDKDQVKEDLYSWLQRRKVLRESIVPTDEREEVWARQKPLNATTTGAAENRLEEKVVGELSAALSILGMNDTPS